MSMEKKTQARDRDNFFWNMMGSTCNALSSMVFLIIVNRMNGTNDGGVFSLAYAVAQLMLTVGTFEVRNYQSTDIREGFRFREYFTFRVISCLLMLIVSAIYITCFGYTGEKAVVTMLLCAYKMIDALSDVFQGMFQQKGRMDLAGKTQAIREILSMIIFIITMQIWHSLIVSSAAIVLVAALWCVLYDFRIVKIWEKATFVFEAARMKLIFKECIPLFFSSFLIMYILNEPKYAIDQFLTLDKQNIFAIIFMPAFVINLFSLFVFRPMLTVLAVSWERRDSKSFGNVIKRSSLWIVLVTVVCLAGAYVLGIPVLSLIYGVDLKGYRAELLIIMFGGGLNALSTVLRYTLTVMRKQYVTLIGYVIAFLFTIVITPVLVQKYSIGGAGAAYVLSMLIMTLVFLAILIKAAHHTMKRGAD